MPRDPQVDLIFSHFTPRYVATGVDPNDLERLKARIERWDDWCRIWSDEAARHERFGEEAAQAGRRVTASESFLRAAIYYHYGKHLFADRPTNTAPRMTRCCAATRAAAPGMNPPAEHLHVPVRGRAAARLAAPSRCTPRRCRSPSSCPGSTPARRSCTPGATRSSRAGLQR